MDPDEERRARVAALIAAGWEVRYGIVYPETKYLVWNGIWYSTSNPRLVEQAWNVYLRQQPE